ncbi:progestin and adipoQ receptor family member 3-like isoform X2 [Dysidea avara]|uniref:progestin and adipoQ receptor family member 3-like isoform X2 n=1 Tax=Dysidea avara TaxID=196820 RepID=UPI003327FC7A
MADLEKGQFLVSPTQQSIARDDVTSSVKSTPIGGKNGIPLYHYHDLPLFLRGNPYITSGYRAYLPTDMCIKSFLLVVDVFSYLPENSASVLDYGIFIIMDVCFQVCMMCSAGYHIFHCQSELASKRWLGLDLAGVSVGFCGILFPGAYYAFYCNQHLQTFYLLLLVMCLTISAVLQMHSAFLSAQWQMRRLLLYSISVFLGLVPVLHWVVLQGGVYGTVVMLFMPYITTIFLLIVIGGVFYATKFPERQFPGRFNFIGSSHQWWHVFVVLSFSATHHFATFGFNYLQKYGCIDHIISEHVRVAR